MNDPASRKPILRCCRNLAVGVATAAFLASLILLWTGAGSRQTPFRVEEAFSVIEKLSSPDFEGRLTGSPGNRKAMEYVATKFREIGLKPFANTGDYYQPFDAEVPELHSVPVLEVHGPGGVVKKYAQYVDFRETYAGHSRPGEVTGKGRVCTNTYSLESPAEPIFLYDNKDSKNLEERPLLQNGIKGVILKDEDKKVVIRGGAISLHSFDESKGFVKFLVKASVMEELKHYVAIGCTLRMKNEFSMHCVKTANVAGFLPAASGKTDDVEIISCHLDHLGKALDGGYYPGALDNASGTGVMTALARSIAEHRSRLNKTFVFVAFNAEEESLGGSWHMVEKPPLLPNRTEVLNFDMVGAKQDVILKLDSKVLSAREDSLDPVVSDPENKIKRIADRMGIPIQFDREADSSDHVPFATQVIPAMTFIHFAEGDYHTVRDDIRTIDKGRLGTVGQLALEYLAETTFRKPLQWLLDSLWAVALFSAFVAMTAEMVFRISDRRRRFLEIAGIADVKGFYAAGSQGETHEAGVSRPVFWGKNALIPGRLMTGVAVFALVLLASAGTFSCSPAFGKRESSDLVSGMRRYEAAFSGSDRVPRPVPSKENDATAEYIASMFKEFGLKPYHQKPGATAENYFLETRSMIPVQKSAPVLRLLAADGSVIRNYARGRDFLETTAGHGGGGRVVGSYKVVTTAYETDGSLCPIYCIRKSDYQSPDEFLFAKWGAKALVIEGDPSVRPEPDYSDEKDSQLLKGSTFLRYIVSPSVMNEIAEYGKRGARIHAEWEVQFEWIYPKTVVGCIPGSETEKNNELVISTALDTPEARPAVGFSKDSHDTALPFFMALAEVMARQHLRPQHPIVFIAFNGTFSGHLGSQAYLDSPMTFRESRKDRWIKESEETSGIVGDYLSNVNRASGRFATGRHVVNLVMDEAGSPTLFLGSESPFFVMPGDLLAKDLMGFAIGRAITLKMSTGPTDFDHRFFTEHWNPALTLALPASSGQVELSHGGPGDMAGILAKLIHSDAVAVAPTPLEWLYLAAKALFWALCAAFVAGRLARILEERKPRAPDPYDEFLKRKAKQAATENGRESV